MEMAAEATWSTRIWRRWTRWRRRALESVCLHYAVEAPKGPAGDKFLEWIGGYFETDWSVNPHWTAKFSSLPEHPITRGVKPFEINDEWYYHMRFREGMRGVTPILTDLPPAETLSRPDGSHSGNPHVRAAIGAEKFSTWRGPSNATMAGGALASRAAMCIGIGPIQISAS